MLRDVLRTAGVQVLLMLGGFVALVLTARLLGPEGRGVLGTLVVWAGLFAACGSLSRESVVLYLAGQAAPGVWFPALFAALLRLYLLLLAATTAVALLLALLARDALFGGLADAELLAGLLLLPPLLWARYQGALLLAIGRLELRNRAQLWSLAVTLAGIGLFVGLAGWGVLGALLAQGLAAAVVALWGLRLLWRAAGRRLAVAPPGVAAGLVRDGLKVHASNVGHYAYGSVDVVTLNSVAGPAAVGWYQLALRLVDVGAALAEAVATVFRARMGGRSPQESWRAQRGPVAWTLVATLAGGALAWWLAPWLIPLIAGEEFRPSVDLFRALVPILFARALQQLLVPQIFARGHFLAASAIAVVMAATSAGLFLWLVPAEGLPGAVTAALLAFGLLPLAVYLGWLLRFERDLRRQRTSEATAAVR